MLLSVERPFVGAFAFHIPGATLLYRTGLVRAVLPASRNMSKRTIEIPRELGRSWGQCTPGYRLCRWGRSAYGVCRGASEAGALVPAASPIAFRRRAMSNVTEERVPPAPAGGGDVCGAGATLGGPVTDHASAHLAGTEPSHRSAAANTRDGSGGAA